MNWDHVEGKWNEFKGQLRSKWAKLTDDDWNQIGGKKDQLLGRLQQRYGYQRDEAEREVDSFIKSI
ncbi:MAG: CsbD family protein [Deltaproteobacteria bacterium]|nr:CsbD family protein [Deltaproteobacteria bacterium]